MKAESTQPDANSTAFAQDLALGQSLLGAGRHLDALKHFARVLEERPDQADAYEAASQALVAATLSDEPILEVWDENDRDPFISTLILQEHCQHSPPILHHCIVSKHTGGVPEALGRVSRKLKATIRGLIANRTINKNVVLLVLLLREHLGELLSQRTITQLHIEWLDKFDFGDLAIPYNCMFDLKTFRRNKDDIVSQVSSASRKTKLLNRLCFYHIVFFEWLTQKNLLDGFDDTQLARLMTARREIDSIPLVDLAALKSLILRHRNGAFNDSTLNAIGFENDFVALAGEVSNTRRDLYRQTSPRRAGFGIGLIENRAWQGLQAARNIAGRRLKFPARTQRKIKVAICVSGQLRGYAKAFPTWKDTLLQNVDYDLFVHSWSRVGRSGIGPSRHVFPFEGEQFSKTYRELCLQIGLEEFKSRYPALITALADTDRMKEEELSEFYGTPHIRLDDDEQLPFSALSNQEKMHRKIQASFDMALFSGSEYDLIMRLRPDLPIKYLGFSWRELREFCHATPTLLADHAEGVHYANLMIGDQFAIGATEPMRIYSTTWTRYPRVAANNLLQCPKTFVGHVSLAQICWLHGIDVKRVPISFGDLQEPERLSSKSILHSLQEDAAGRMNRMDGELLDAVSMDLQK